MTGGPYDVIAWCHDPKVSARDLLARARERGVDQVAAAERGPKFPTPYPSSEFPGRWADLVAWFEAREHWRREKLGSPVMDGLNLTGLPWGPDPEALVAGLARFALGALARVAELAAALTSADDTAAGLRRDLAAAHEAKAKGDQAAAAHLAAVTVQAADRLAVAKADAAAWRDTAEQVEADLRAQLAAARADAAQARQDARDAGVDRAAALVQADAWRTSATATADALATLRAALRIPVPGDADLVVARDR